jgi:uncharacterized protein
VTPSPSAAGSAPSAPGPAAAELETPALQPVFESLADLADDSTVPRNIRRGAVSAREALLKPHVALDVRIASAVYVLDDLANDPNLPTHGRTAIWSIISSLESLS